MVAINKREKKYWMLLVIGGLMSWWGIQGGNPISAFSDTIGFYSNIFARAIEIAIEHPTWVVRAAATIGGFVLVCYGYILLLEDYAGTSEGDNQ